MNRQDDLYKPHGSLLRRHGGMGEDQQHLDELVGPRKVPTASHPLPLESSAW